MYWNTKRPVRANGLYQEGKAPAERIGGAYGRLASEVVGRNGFVRFWDALARAPYLWNAERRIFITYEDPESLTLKARYIREHKLVGVMFWEYSNDPTGALLDVLDAELRDGLPKE